MLVMPEFFTYRNLQRMTGGCTDVTTPQKQCTALGHVDAGLLSRRSQICKKWVHSLEENSISFPGGEVDMNQRCQLMVIRAAEHIIADLNQRSATRE